MASDFERERDEIGFERWRGRVDSFMENVPQRIDTLFEKWETQHNAINNLSEKLTSLSSKIAIVAAIGSFAGTVITSLLVAAIMKVFIK